jgi:hypothetical protein
MGRSHAAAGAVRTGNGFCHYAGAKATEVTATEATTAAPRRIAGTPTSWKRVRGLQIDDQFEFCGVLDR